MSNLVLHPCSVLTPYDPNSSYTAAIHEDPNNAAIAVIDPAGNPLTAGVPTCPAPDSLHSDPAPPKPASARRHRSGDDGASGRAQAVARAGH